MYTITYNKSLLTSLTLDTTIEMLNDNNKNNPQTWTFFIYHLSQYLGLTLPLDIDQYIKVVEEKYKTKELYFILNYISTTFVKEAPQIVWRKDF